jgi:Ca-activated chloride channel family protein
MDQRPGFSLSVSQNRYLSVEDHEMHAILTVTADGAAEQPEAPAGHQSGHQSGHPSGHPSAVRHAILLLENSDLVADLATLMRAAMARGVPDVQVRVRTMPFARLRFLRQTFPIERDLTAFGTAVDEWTAGFTIGSWGDGEEREFHLCLKVDPADHPTGEDIQAGRVDLAVVHAGGQAEVCGRPQPIVVHWTSDVELSSVIDSKVAHYTGYAELGSAVRAGWEAYRAGDLDRAGTDWGRAVALAAELGHGQLLTRLGRLVYIIGDPADGVVRVRPNLKPRVLFSALLGSTTTTRSPQAVPTAASEPAGPDRTCPACAYVSPASAAYCARCGCALGGPA